VIGRLIVVTLPLYFAWEMLQAPAFTGMPEGWLAATAVNDVERTRADVRLIHLLAHLKTRDLLSVEQRHLYHAARWSD